MLTNLKTALKSKGISYEIASAVIGLHRNTFCRKINGDFQFTVTEAFKIAEVLLPEFNIKYLFTNDCNEIGNSEESHVDDVA